MLSSCWLTSPFSGCFNTAIKGVVGGVHETSEAGPARTRMNQGQTTTEKALVNGTAGGFQQSSITLGGGRGTLGGVTTIAPKPFSQEAKPPPSSQIHHQEKGPQDSTQKQQSQQQEHPQPQTPRKSKSMGRIHGSGGGVAVGEAGNDGGPQNAPSNIEEGGGGGGGGFPPTAYRGHRRVPSDGVAWRHSKAMESEMDGDDKFLKRTYKSEYRKKFRPFSQYQYVDGKFHKSKAEGESPNAWYKEVLELRKQAGQYRCRGWGVETASDRMAEIYTKQVELWEQVSRRSSLQALSLASAAPSRPISKAEKEIENSRRSSPIKHSRERPSTAPSKQKPAPVHKPADKIDGKAAKDSSTPRHHYEKTTGASDGFIITSPTRDRIEPIACSDWSTRRSPRKTPPITSPVKDGIPATKRRPPRAISVARTSTSKDNKAPPPPPPSASNKSSTSLGKTLKSRSSTPAKKIPEIAGRSVSVGPENRSPKRASRPTTGTHTQAPSAKTERRPRPTSLTTSSRRKGADSAIPHHEAKKPTKKPHDISASPKRATDLKSRDERRQSSEEDKKDKEKDGKEVIKDALKDTVGRKSTPEPRFDPEKYEPVVKTPPEPTRVKSPDQVMVKSPDPVNWTVPLDTGKTFTVTSNVPEGEASRGTPSSEHRPPLESRSRQTPEPTKVYQGSLAGTPITTAGTVSSASSAPTSTSTAASSHLPSKTDSATSVKTSTPSTTTSTTSTSVPGEKAKEPVSGSSGSSISVSSDTVPVDDKISKIPSEISLSTASKPIDSKLSSIKETSPQPTDSSKPYQELPNTSEVVETNISPSASIPSSVGLPSGTFEVVGSNSFNDSEFSDSLLQDAPTNASLLTMNERKDFGESNLESGKFKDNFEDSDEDVKDIAQKAFEDNILNSKFSQNEHEFETRNNELEQNIENTNNSDFISETKSIASSLEENHSDHEEQNYEANCKENSVEDVSDSEIKNTHLIKDSVNDSTEKLNDAASYEETMNFQDVKLNIVSSIHQPKNEHELFNDDLKEELKENFSQKTCEADINFKIGSDKETEYNKNNETFDENVTYNYDTLQNTDNSAFLKYSLHENEETSTHYIEKPENTYDNYSEKVNTLKNDNELIVTQEGLVHNLSVESESIKSENIDEHSHLTSTNSNNFDKIDEPLDKNNVISSIDKESVFIDNIESSTFKENIPHGHTFHDDKKDDLPKFGNKLHEDSEMFSDELNETFVSEEALLTSSKTEEESAVENTLLIPSFSSETPDVFDDEKPISEEIAGFDGFQSNFSKQTDVKNRTLSETSVHSEDSSERVPLETSSQTNNSLEVSTPEALLHIEGEIKRSPSETSLKDEESGELQENTKIEPSVNESDFLTIGEENSTQQSFNVSFENGDCETAKQSSSSSSPSSSSSSSSESDNEEPHFSINFQRDKPLKDEIKKTPSEISLHSEDSTERAPLEISPKTENPLEKLQSEELNELQENMEIKPIVNESDVLAIDKENVTQQSIDISFKEDNYETAKQGSYSYSSESEDEKLQMPLNFQGDEPFQENQNKDDPLIIPSQNQSDSEIFSNTDIESRRKSSFDEDKIISSIRDDNVENNNNPNEMEEIPTTDDVLTVEENLCLESENKKFNLLETEIKNDLQESVNETKAPVHEYDFSSNNFGEDYNHFSSNHSDESQENEFEGKLNEFQPITKTEENIIDKTPITGIPEENYLSSNWNEDSNSFIPADNFNKNSSSQDNQISTDITSLSKETSLSYSQEELSNAEVIADHSVNPEIKDLSEQFTNLPNLSSESVEESKAEFSQDDSNFNTTTENITLSDDETIPELALQKKRVSFSLAQNSGNESESESDSNSVHSFNDKKEIMLHSESEDVHEENNTCTYNADSKEEEILSTGDYPVYSPTKKEFSSENSEHFYGTPLNNENSVTNDNEFETSHSHFSGLDVNEIDEKNNEDKYFEQNFDEISNHPTFDNVFEPSQEGILRETISDEEKRENSSEDDEELYSKGKETIETQDTQQEHLQLNTSFESSNDTKDINLVFQRDDYDYDDSHSVTSAESQKYEELSSKGHSQMDMFSENSDGIRYDIQLQHENDEENNSFSSEASQVQNATNNIYNEAFDSTISDEMSYRNTEVEENEIFEKTNNNVEFHQKFESYESSNESDPEIRSKDVVKRLFTSSSENINKTHPQDDILLDITQLETDTLQTFSQVKVEKGDSFDSDDVSTNEKTKEQNLDSNKYTGVLASDNSNNFETEDINALHQQLNFQNNYVESNNLLDENQSANFHFDPSVGTNRNLSEEFNYQEKFYVDEHFPSEDSARGSDKEQSIFESSEFRSEDPNLFINAELKYDQRNINTSDDFIHPDSIQSVGYTSMQDLQSFPSEHSNVNMESSLNPFSNGNYKIENSVLEKTNTDLTSVEAELHSSPTFEYLKSSLPNNNTSENTNYLDNLNNGLHLQDHEYDSYESSESVIIKNNESSSSSQKNKNEFDFNKISTEET